MKTKKTATLATLSIVTALFLFSPAALAASSTPVNMSAGGIITDAGSQSYSFSGGIAVGGEVLGNPITMGAPINFHFSASVSGLSTSGSGQITVPAASVGGGNGAYVISVEIVDQEAAAVFPLNPDGSSCTTGCTSQIPIMFVGVATISNQGRSASVPVAVESPYWDPFGNPIVITSLDSTTSPALYMVVTYHKATIDWSQVVVQGIIGGAVGSEPVSGYYATVTNSHENLFTGMEKDAGQIFFTGMSDPSMNGQGSLSGSTTIPPLSTNSYDCTSAYAVALGVYWPFGSGTCVLTGASSSGSIQMSLASGAKMTGTYATTWSVPSLTTGTTFTATVTQK